jgi:folate-binding Fe-S cluster repair protein YgfZ
LDEDFGGGILKIEGRGTLEFLHNKLTANFLTPVDSINNFLDFQEACLLDAKGRLVDWLRVSVLSNEREPQAWILTSPGPFSSADLLERLDPFVFPMDQVTLTSFDKTQENAFAFSLASTQYEHVRKVILDLQKTDKKLPLSTSGMVFPSGRYQSALWEVNDQLQILVVPSVGLPSVACVGYSFVFMGSREATQLGRSVLEYLIGDDNAVGPIEVGPRELETLRVQAGQPGFGHEFGRHQAASRSNNDDMIKTSPLELHWKSTLNLEKGCYLGQEGVASMLKNPRGPPRLLYSVIFQDDFNCYEAQSRGDNSGVDNLTLLPQPGQNLYALGSNEKILVGTITSMGEAGGTGSPDTVALALVKRPDSVQKQMKEMQIEIPRNDGDFSDTDIMSGSGILQPPPMDPLDGLEIIVEGTFTIGVLRSIATRRFRHDANMFDDSIQVKELDERPKKASPWQKDDQAASGDSDVIKDIEAVAAKAAEEAERAAQEAKRKAEKMEMLKKRAEEAMSRRKQKKQ